MAAPLPKSTPINLKTNGNSVFWLNANNVETGHTVVVKRTDNGPGYWTGTVTAKHSGNPKGAKVSVSYNPGIPPFTKTQKRKSHGAGDIIEVTITITNTTTNESGSLNDEVIID